MPTSDANDSSGHSQNIHCLADLIAEIEEKGKLYCACDNFLSDENTRVLSNYTDLAGISGSDSTPFPVHIEKEKHAYELLKDIHTEIALRTCRFLAFLAANITSIIDLENNQGWRAALLWLEFLTQKAKLHYLTVHRAADATFYDIATKATLPKNQWKNGWNEVLPWLTRPERLTIPELEIALAIFDWKAKTPQFTPWLKKNPHFLLGVEQFLQRRYCWLLLNAFRQAEQARDPVSFLTRIYMRFNDISRIWGYCIVGQLALYGCDMLSFFLGKDSTGINMPGWPYILTESLGAVLLLLYLAIQDIKKQNLGLLKSEHWRRRAYTLCAVFISGGIAVSALFTLLFSLYKAPYPEGRYYFAAFIAMGITSALAGALIQWFWEDRSAIEAP